MTKHAVVIAGGGPTGLMLAGELALAGIDVVIVERRTNQDLSTDRERGWSSLPHYRGARSARHRGTIRRSEGKCHAGLWRSPMVMLDISDFPTRHNYVLALVAGGQFEPIAG